MSVQPVKEAKGKHHIHAQALTDLSDPEFAAELYQHAFVSNRLNTGDNWSRIRGPAIEYAKPPMERLVGRGPILFTFEIDDQNPGALEIQLGWCLPGPWSKRWSHSKIGQLFQAMSRYDDFLGLTVNWSGNKSLHVHLVFDLDLIHRLLPERLDIREGLVAHWDRLRPEVAAILGTERFDPALRLPEQYRRLPQGGRCLEADNILGAPAGTLVPQLTVWEKYRDRRGKETIGLMFQPGPFIPNPVRKHRTPTGSSTRQSIGDLTADEHQHCVGELARHFPGWPKLARLAYEDGEWRAYFFNHEDDRNPASVMREGHSTVLFQGWNSEALVASSPRLPDRLGVMMAEWIDRFHGRDTELGADADAGTDTLTLQAENVPLRALTPQEKAYGEACRDYDSLKHETARLILNNLPQHDRLWVRGGEGSHKTRSMLANHGRIMVGRDHRLAMYAFDSYLKAAEKVREFNEQGHRHYHAVLLKSFSRSYGETCERLALDPWTPQSARDAGFATVWHAMVENSGSRVPVAEGPACRDVGRDRDQDPRVDDRAPRDAAMAGMLDDPLVLAPGLVHILAETSGIAIASAMRPGSASPFMTKSTSRPSSSWPVGMRSSGSSPWPPIRHAGLGAPRSRTRPRWPVSLTPTWPITADEPTWISVWPG